MLSPLTHCVHPVLRRNLHAEIFAALGGLHKIHDGEHLDEALQAVEDLDLRGIPVPKDIIYCILRGCTKRQDLAAARRVQSLMVKQGMAKISLFADYLIRLFTSFKCLPEAHETFCMVLEPSIYTWNAIISAHVNLDDFPCSLELYHAMRRTGIKPSKVTFLYVVKACACIGQEGLEQGRLIHNHITRCGLDADGMLSNALVDMYAKCGNLEQAQEIFDDLPCRTVVSYGALIAGYAQHGSSRFAFELLERMQKEGIKPNRVIFLCIMKACSKASSLEQGIQIHNEVAKNGLLADVVVGSALVDVYVKCGNVSRAYSVFDKLPAKNVVTWGSMIAGFVEHGDSRSALACFRKMQQDGIKPDRPIFLGVLRACASNGSTIQGQMVHHQVIKSELERDISIGNTLVDMYAKCGSFNEAQNVFNKLWTRDIVSWGALITGYALNGHFGLAWQCIQDMQREGVKPSEIIFTSILAGCSNAGLIEEGYEFFNTMVLEFGITPSTEHYNCIIDLLGRAGRLEAAWKLLQSMPIDASIVAWRSLLTGCKTYGNTQLGKLCFEEVSRLDPTGASSFVTMSNIYEDAQMWDNMTGIQDLKKSKAAMKKPGRAFIEVANYVREFTVGEKFLEDTEGAGVKVKRLAHFILREGYVPEISTMVEFSVDENKEEIVPGECSYANYLNSLHWSARVPTAANG